VTLRTGVLLLVRQLRSGTKAKPLVAHHRRLCCLGDARKARRLAVNVAKLPELLRKP
jgi:hypothetical protein